MDSNEAVSPLLGAPGSRRDDPANGFIALGMAFQAFRSCFACVVSVVKFPVQLGKTMRMLWYVCLFHPKERKIMEEYSRFGVEVEGWIYDYKYAYQAPSSPILYLKHIHVLSFWNGALASPFLRIEPKVPVLVLPNDPKSGCPKSFVESYETDLNVMEILQRNNLVAPFVVYTLLFSAILFVPALDFFGVVRFAGWYSLVIGGISFLLSLRDFNRWRENIASVARQLSLSDLPTEHGEDIEEALRKSDRRKVLESSGVVPCDVTMTTKFESSGPARVSGLAFHAEKKWLGASLDDGMILLWDCQTGRMVNQWQAHSLVMNEWQAHFFSSNRVDFHPTESVLVSAGDDYKILFWNCEDGSPHLSPLLGHLDYIRSVQFHPNAATGLPLVLSASDDLTIRLWHYHTRTCLCVAIGHKHCVMSASFHPSYDLIVSASLDHTVRVWDYTPLRVAMQQSADLTIPPRSQMELSDARFVLRGHKGGISWAAFHPTEPLIVSAALDQTVKLWRFHNDLAWEVGTVGRHSHTVSCCLFLHPQQQQDHQQHDKNKDVVILTGSQDQSIGVFMPANWSSGGSSGDPAQLRLTGQHIYSRASDRFWLVAAHKSENLLAAAHDGGFIVFQLDKEDHHNVNKQQGIESQNDPVGSVLEMV